MGMRNKVIKVAKGQIGQVEPTGDDKYIRWYNSANGTAFEMNAPWCAMFTSWVFRQAGVPETLLPNFSACSTVLNWAKRQKIWYSRLTSHVPKPGEVILFDWNVDGTQDHAGIVETVTANQITTIEGNTSDSVNRRTYSRTSKYILGYIDVQYPDEAEEIIETPVVTTPTVEQPVVIKPTVVKPAVSDPAATPSNKKNTATTSKEVMTVKEIQQFMVDTYKVGIVVDGVWGPASKKAMAKCVQTVINRFYGGHLIVDGIFGYASKKSMPIIRDGASGELVKLIQMCLIVAGFAIEVTGKMDKVTLETVELFQKKKSLLADREIGPDTMAALLK